MYIVVVLFSSRSTTRQLISSLTAVLKSDAGAWLDHERALSSLEDETWDADRCSVTMRTERSRRKSNVSKERLREMG